MEFLKVCQSALVILFLYSCDQVSYDKYWQEASLEKKNLYLAFRGTRSKEGFFARDFNMKDSLSSHVGFLLYEKDHWYVFHVLDFKDNMSDLRRQLAVDFFNSLKEEINYASIWHISSFDSLEVGLAREGIRHYESKSIEFDRAFSLKDSTKLYCSEFIYKVLKLADQKGLELNVRKTKLSGIYAKYFRKDSLEYIPVDLFQSVNQIQMVKEWNFH